ncbi:TPA: MmcQ/YjbR family DNA-binding protein [Streptococcus pyogenes]|nr:MmcQ/YjbR family DNA-binding protein [Streptococcus pyogenes]HES2103334.1 MmcQ/YjbR family DNA-binding protein [Streptococcus pyogenes]HES2520477.1 MmcQ/YjbR family DNA-binding protein [Streptococcus pyogenes]HES3699404.1 MmcQ/YjbR family DNA-binding protein [Streptococcus pyogenes]HES3712903.1 MmcQ/YjbR family DNA-binding protein [Streptococcus pyogenes]
MSLATDYFSRQTPIVEKLMAYGFEKRDNGYFYNERFMEGEFEAQLRIDEAGNIWDRVIDCDLEEDYLPLQQAAWQGTYTGQVRAAYLELLERLSVACFEATPFQSMQANRLAKHITKEWSDPMDYPFEKHPDLATYRVGGKWYAMIFSLLADKLDQIPERLVGQTCEVMTVKVNPKAFPQLLQQEGIYPAYHMSKKNWISIILDDKVTDDKLWTLVTQSRQLVNPNGLSNPNGPDYWVIPANLKYYDIDAEFAANDVILWTQKAGIAVGDYVLIYITAPVKSIRYVCQVLETDIPNEGYRKNPNIDKLIRLRKCQQYKDGLLSFDLMKKHGVAAVRGPRRLSPQLIAFLKEKEYFKENN